MNIPDVRVAVGKQFNISEADARAPANLSDADRTRLFDYTNQFIATHPADFTPEQVASARKMVDAWGVNSPLLDTSFDWGMLASEVGNNALKAGEAVASVGNGVLSAFKLGSWLIPLAVVAFVGIYVFGFYKKQTR